MIEWHHALRERASNKTNLGGVSLNAQIMETSGAGRVLSRIGVIKSVLIDRSEDMPDPS